MSTPVAGLLLTGGTSSRMGRDKASLRLPGSELTFSEHVGLCLVGALALGPVLEVGEGRSGLPTIESLGVTDPRTGPLSAVVAGCEALKRLGFEGDVVVLATDLPLVTAALVDFLATEPSPGSLVPVVGGRAQPLAARWNRADLEAARHLEASGERSVMAVFAEEHVAERTRFVGEDVWGRVADPEAFTDVDEPSDLSRLED